MMSLSDAITIAGGPVAPESCPAVIPPDQLIALNETIGFLAHCYAVILSDYDLTGEVAIALTHSPGFSCRVRPLDGGKFAILVPLGMPARVRVMAHILLRYWAQEKRVLIHRSVRDNIPVDNEDVPKLLRPIFLDDPDFNGYWEAIYELDNAVAADPRFEPDVGELIHLSLVYQISHEITHVLHRHFDLIERSKRENLGLSESEIRRGLELDADEGAAAMTMKVLQLSDQLFSSAGRQFDIRLAWLRLSYVVTMLFGIFDAQRKYLGAYEEGEYNHPLVRCEVFSQAAVRSFMSSDDMKNDLKRILHDGWMRCIFAFNDLNLDTMRGMFGGFPEGRDLVPLQSLIYSYTMTMALWKKIDKASTQLDQVRKLLLPMFRTTQ